MGETFESIQHKINKYAEFTQLETIEVTLSKMYEVLSAYEVYFHHAQERHDELNDKLDKALEELQEIKENQQPR